ncbi:hypothetical protein M569_12855, partial [Genlisea aurea]
GRRLKKIIWELIDVAGCLNVEDLIPWLGWINEINGLNSRIKYVTDGLDEFLTDFLEEARERMNKKKNAEPYSNFIDAMLDIQRENRDNDDLSIDDEVIKAIFLDMFSPAVHTPAVTLEWIMAVVKNRKVMNTLQE